MKRSHRSAQHDAIPSILEIIRDPRLFGSLFQGLTWFAWQAFLAAVFGLLTSDKEAALIRRCTGRKTLPAKQAREAWVIVGRRGGKSRIAAMLAVFLACFRDYSSVLSEGERGVVMLIASDRKQARVLKGYVSGLLHAVAMLEAMILNETAESIELLNRIVIEVHTASFRAVRGYTVVAAILDEIAFWPTDDAANPDTEILTALRPAMATVPGALLIAISSPYARRGELWKAYRDHFGKDDNPVLVWQANTRTMNPAVPEEVIHAAYEKDAASAEAEYGAQFRRDIDSFISLEVLEAARMSGRFEIPSLSEVRYTAFVDVSGGSADSMTLAIAHVERGRAVLDAIREAPAPFNPDLIVEEFARLLKSYGLSKVTGDRYGGEWPRDRFRTYGITYDVADRPKSDFYRDMLPILNSRQLDLLDHQKLFAQLSRLERRTGRSGKDTIDHPPGSQDDVANAAAGAAVLALEASRVKTHIWFTDQLEPGEKRSTPDHHQLLRSPYGLLIRPRSSDVLTCAECGGFDQKTEACQPRGILTRPTMPACDLYASRESVPPLN